MQQLSELLLREGISTLGIGDIASRLQCSRRRLYEVAASKQELLFAVARRHFEEGLLRGHRAAAEEADPSRVAVAYAMAGVETAVQLSTAFLRDLEATPEGSAIFDAYQRQRAEGGIGLLEEGMKKGYFNTHNASVAIELALGAAMRLRRAEFLAQAGLTLEQAMAEAYHLMHYGILAEPYRSSPAGKSGATRPNAGPKIQARQRPPSARKN